MNLQTGTIEITGLSIELMQEIDRRARAMGHTAEEYLRTVIEQQSAYLLFSSEETETLRQELQAARDQIDQGNFYAYPSVNAMMDDIEAEAARRIQQKQNGGAQ